MSLIETDAIIGRDRMVAFLRQELIGPKGGAQETVQDPPHIRYIMGTLFPKNAKSDATVQVEIEEGVFGSYGDELPDDPISFAHEWMPASVGLSFYVSGRPTIDVTVAGARYLAESSDRKRSWRRLPLDTAGQPLQLTVDNPQISIWSGLAVVHSHWRKMPYGYLITVTLVNEAEQAESDKPDSTKCLFQVSLTCKADGGEILEYPSVDRLSADKEDEELRLLYRKAKCYAVGHGCAANWDTKAVPPPSVAVEFLPQYELPQITHVLKDDESDPQEERIEPFDQRALDLTWLADDHVSTADLTKALSTFVASYRIWIQKLPDRHDDIPERLEQARIRLLGRLDTAADRMQGGVELLKNKTARAAFRLANLAMLMQMRHSKEDLGGKAKSVGTASHLAVDFDYLHLDGYRWRPFQLAFLLLVLPSLASTESAERDIVDLIWFPTGGGKTEAYLGLAAFEIFHRRLVHGANANGTAVISRYTLRLLTAQQFQRASTLMCACELLRAERKELGAGQISIGLWLGNEVLPPTLAKAREAFDEMREEIEPRNRFQLERCPWCGTRIVPQIREDDDSAYGIRVDNTDFAFFCPDPACEFSSELPVQVIDEVMYQSPPTFLIGTVDKFANLTWVDRSGAFFGQAGTRLSPGLIIQDELHLLSGPLGTTVGVYESAIEALVCASGPRPKIVSSTATIRRADEQITALYGRNVAVFPPSGLEANDSYFARIEPKGRGRLYVGAMAPSHTMAVAIRNSVAALAEAPCEIELTAAERDAYWTQVIYHNSLRELGRTVTLARDDIPSQILVIAKDEAKMRKLSEESVVELTSNVPGRELPARLDRMQLDADDKDAISILATTNMLSVGVDVPRLGLMLVNGQPKTTSEYIQASSRVGRSFVPGLVLTLLSATKPRDRSHYERFVAFHSALYRYVEPTSVTPYAPPSRSRSLHAALVILMRHAGGLSGNAAAGQFRADSEVTQNMLDILLRRIRTIDADELEASRSQLNALCGQWEAWALEAKQAGKIFYYTSTGRGSRGLLKNFGEDGEGWPTLQSMRNVDRQARIELLGEA